MIYLNQQIIIETNKHEKNALCRSLALYDSYFTSG